MSQSFSLIYIAVTENKETPHIFNENESIRTVEIRKDLSKIL
jgi:hypothetical protein